MGKFRKREAAAAVPQQVEALLQQALQQGASDVYLLPDAEGLSVRFRVRGAQEDVARLEGEAATQALAHVKVLAGMLTYRTGIAQDGVIRREGPAGRTELRAAAMPTLFGERITIRVVDKARTPMVLDELAFPAGVTAALRRLIARPHGLIVLTGPTGCGKTTTIYALLRELLRGRQDPASIITLEDPVESVLDGVSQASVRSEEGEWNYPAALRAALRQDVKTLMVGELRDRQVIHTVLDAALTGHRIITTYHAGDIPSVYARLLHQGFEPFLVAAAIHGVVAQRLVRDSEGRLRPVVAVLEVDDAWREFVCARPQLGALRERLAGDALADLAAIGANLRHAGVLAPEVAASLEG